MKLTIMFSVAFCCLLASCSSTNVQKNDNILINKTLSEIIKNKKKLYSGFKGRGDIVINNRSLKINPESNNLKNKRSKKNQCVLSKELISSLKESNSNPIDLKNILSKSKSYRFKKSEENDPGIFIKNIFSGDVKSYISISKPGYSPDRKSSIVLISYTWSTHRAFAKFLYIQDINNWKLKCSEFIYHP